MKTIENQWKNNKQPMKSMEHQRETNDNQWKPIEKQ